MEKIFDYGNYQVGIAWCCQSYQKLFICIKQRGSFILFWGTYAFIFNFLLEFQQIKELSSSQ